MPKLLSPFKILCVTGLALAWTFANPSAARAQSKTDVVVLANGDLITCEVEQLERGRLEVSTDSMGTLQIEWDDVREITSSLRFEVELETGEKFFGRLQPSTAVGDVMVSNGTTEVSLERDAVVRVDQIREGFWNQLDGSMDVGFSVTKANEARQWNFTGEIGRRTERVETRIDLSSLFSTQEGIENTSRHTLGVQVSRYLPQRWLAAAVGQFQRNDELDLKLRSVTGGAVGRFLLQTNRTILATLAGVVFNRERFFGPEPSRNNAEGLVTIQFQKFTFDDPETDISVTFFVLPNLTEPGRVRLELDARIRREIGDV